MALRENKSLHPLQKYWRSEPEIYDHLLLIYMFIFLILACSDHELHVRSSDHWWHTRAVEKKLIGRNMAVIEKESHLWDPQSSDGHFDLRGTILFLDIELSTNLAKFLAS